MSQAWGCSLRAVRLAFCIAEYSTGIKGLVKCALLVLVPRPCPEHTCFLPRTALHPTWRALLCFCGYFIVLLSYQGLCDRRGFFVRSDWPRCHPEASGCLWLPASWQGSLWCWHAQVLTIIVVPCKMSMLFSLRVCL